VLQKEAWTKQKRIDRGNEKVLQASPHLGHTLTHFVLTSPFALPFVRCPSVRLNDREENTVLCSLFSSFGGMGPDDGLFPLPAWNRESLLHTPCPSCRLASFCRATSRPPVDLLIIALRRCMFCVEHDLCFWLDGTGHQSILCDRLHRAPSIRQERKNSMGGGIKRTKGPETASREGLLIGLPRSMETSKPMNLHASINGFSSPVLSLPF